MEATGPSVWKSVQRARSFAETEETENVRRMHIEALRERVRGRRYEIDAQAVAEAVVRRLAEVWAERAVRRRARSRPAGAGARRG